MFQSKREVASGPTGTITTTDPNDASNQPPKSANWEKQVVDHEQRIAELEKENALLKAKLNIN